MASDAEYLAQLETAITGYFAGGCVTSYTYEGVTVTRENLDSMLRARNSLRQSAAYSDPTKSRVTYARRGCR